MCSFFELSQNRGRLQPRLHVEHPKTCTHIKLLKRTHRHKQAHKNMQSDEDKDKNRHRDRHMHRHRDKHTDAQRKDTNKTGQTEDRSKEEAKQERQETRDATVRKRETRECSRRRQRQRASRCAACVHVVRLGLKVRCVASETDQTPTATAPPHPNPTLTHSTPSKKKSHLHDQTPRACRNWPAPNPASLTLKQRMHKRIPREEHRNIMKMNSVMMLLTFSKVKKGSWDFNPFSVWLPASGK